MASKDDFEADIDAGIAASVAKFGLDRNKHNSIDMILNMAEQAYGYS